MTKLSPPSYLHKRVGYCLSSQGTRYFLENFLYFVFSHTLPHHFSAVYPPFYLQKGSDIIKKMCYNAYVFI